MAASFFYAFIDYLSMQSLPYCTCLLYPTLAYAATRNNLHIAHPRIHATREYPGA